jgi:hypothetical protein
VGKGKPCGCEVVGARLIALTGTLDCLQPEYDPLVEKDQRWDWRYDMRWDSRPARPVLYPISGRHSLMRSEAPSPSLARISDVRIALYMDTIRTDKSTRCRECVVRVTAGGRPVLLCARNGAFQTLDCSPIRRHLRSATGQIVPTREVDDGPSTSLGRITLNRRAPQRIAEPRRQHRLAVPPHQPRAAPPEPVWHSRPARCPRSRRSAPAPPGRSSSAN